MVPAATVVRALETLADEDRFEEYDEAEDVLLSLAPEDGGAVPELLRHFRDERNQGRFWILLALEQIAPQDQTVFAAVAEHSRDSDEHIRGKVIRYLGQHGSAYRDIAVPALAEAARLQPAQDYVSNTAKAFTALVHVAGWRGAWQALRREKGTAK